MRELLLQPAGIGRCTWQRFRQGRARRRGTSGSNVRKEEAASGWWRSEGIGHATLVGWTTRSRGGTGWLGLQTEEERWQLWLVVLDREGIPRRRQWAGSSGGWDKIPSF